METEKLILNILKENLTFENYCILKLANKYNIQDYNEKIPCLDTKVKFLQGLDLLDLQNPPELTKKSVNLLHKIEEIDVKDNSKYDFDELHKKLQDLLYKHLGRKQKMVQNKYQFLPNPVDLKDKILKCAKKYKLSDFKKIESLLLSHTNIAIKANFEYIPTIEYYIQKSSISKLATDYFSEVEEVKEEKIEPQDIKNLF